MQFKGDGERNETKCSANTKKYDKDKNYSLRGMNSSAREKLLHTKCK